MPRSIKITPTTPATEEPIGLTIDQLPVEARLRLEHAEKWVAWGLDDRSVITSGDDFVEVSEAARRAGFPQPMMEWVPPPFRQCPSAQRADP